MRKRAFGDDFISRYRMLSAFHLKRAPLVLLIVGGVCTGKTTVATKISQVRAYICDFGPNRLVVCLLLAS
jgi:2-phosphoglycerate kinase